MSSISGLSINLNSTGVGDLVHNLDAGIKVGKSNSAADKSNQAASSKSQGSSSGSSILKAINTAVIAALDKLQSGGGTSGSSDPNQIIQKAIMQVLQGKNPSTMETNGNSNTGSGDTKGTGGKSTQNSDQALLKALQSAGVSQQQFVQDLHAAIKQIQASNTGSPSGSLRGLQPGANVDLTT